MYHRKKTSTHRLRRSRRHYRLADDRLLNSVGREVSHAKFGVGWRIAFTLGGNEDRSQNHFCRVAVNGRKQGEDVHAIDGARFARFHVSDAFAIRNVFPSTHSKSCRDCAHPHDCHWLQDKTVGAGVGTLADGVERLPEPILDDSFLPPDARFPQVRLLPNDVGHRRSPPGRRSRAGKHLHGCA